MLGRQSKIAGLKGWLKYKKGSLIGIGMIVLLYSIYFMRIGYPRLVTSLNPTKVPARITYVYHRCAGAKSIGYRYYDYEYECDGIIYHGYTGSQLNEVIGNTGDTIIIRCNKVRPKYSAFWQSDNPNLKIRKLTPKERRKLYELEPSEYDKQ